MDNLKEYFKDSKEYLDFLQILDLKINGKLVDETYNMGEFIKLYEGGEIDGRHIRELEANNTDQIIKIKIYRYKKSAVVI
jgi:hypothetical protein